MLEESILVQYGGGEIVGVLEQKLPFSNCHYYKQLEKI